LSIKDHTLERTSKCIDECICICSILSKSENLTLIKDTGFKLKTILRCIRKLCDDVCYSYFPTQDITKDKQPKSNIYRVLNKHVVFYNQRTASKLKNILIEQIIKYIDNVTLPRYVQVEFKTKDTRYKYFISYQGIDRTFSILTYDNLIKELKSLDDIVSIIINSLTKITSCKDIKFIRSLVNINNDQIVLKYLCKFNYINVEVSVLNTILISMLIKKVIP